MYILRRQNKEEYHYFVAADLIRKSLSLTESPNRAYAFKNSVDCEMLQQEINRWTSKDKFEMVAINK